MIQTPQVDLTPLAPIGFTAITAMLVLLGEVFFTRMRVSEARIGAALAGVSVLGLVCALSTAFQGFATGQVGVFNPENPLYRLDSFSAFVTVLIGLAAALSCGLSVYYLREMRINHGEFYALLLVAVSGMMLMVGAVDFLTVFLGLELMSIPIYVLAGFDRTKLRSNESALKYFLIGSFASAILLYGVALLYGASGGTSFEAVREAFDPANPLAMIGLALVIVGFAFKISSVPFHQWTPDVYEGAPALVTAFMSVTVKTAAFAVLLRVLTLSFGPAAVDGVLRDVLWVLAALSMIVGNLMAVIQDNVKRLLAYSSVAHAGYVLIGLVAGTPDGYSAVLFYLAAYTFMNLGAFGVVVALARDGRDCEEIGRFAGLARTRPALAAMMTIFMLSLAGIPGTVGFIAKLRVFMAAVPSDLLVLVIIGVLTSVVSIYYYLRIPVLMYMHEPEEGESRRETGLAEGLVVGICAVLVVLLGLFPGQGRLPLLDWPTPPLLEWARQSVELLFRT